MEGERNQQLEPKKEEAEMGSAFSLLHDFLTAKCQFFVVDTGKESAPNLQEKESDHDSSGDGTHVAGIGIPAKSNCNTTLQKDTEGLISGVRIINTGSDLNSSIIDHELNHRYPVQIIEKHNRSIIIGERTFGQGIAPDIRIDKPSGEELMRQLKLD